MFAVFLTKLCNSDIELRKCCGRCFGAVPALRRRESVGFAFLRSDEREDDVCSALYLQRGEVLGAEMAIRIIYGNDTDVGINLAITVISFDPIGHGYFHTPLAVIVTFIRPWPLGHPLYLRGGACMPFYRKPFCI